MGKQLVVSGEEELRLRRQWDREVLPKALSNRWVFDWLRARFQRISEGEELAAIDAAPQQGATDPGKRPKSKRDFAEERRQKVEMFFRAKGLNLAFPNPNVSNREFARRRKLDQELFFRPATPLVSYEEFMTSVGQGDDWTVVDEAERAKIAWEPAASGYWFWAEVPLRCPRLMTSWSDLMQAIRLLSLEEYVVVWYFMKADGVILDPAGTWAWLRTRFGESALSAFEDGGRVDVRRNDPIDFASPYVDMGGRLSEVVA